MKFPATFIALAALAVLAMPSCAVAGGTVHVTSGNVVAARPVGPQPMLVMVRPGFAQVPVVVGPGFALTQPLVVTQQPSVVTQPIIIGQPFMITQPGIVQRQILVPSNGVFFTSQGLTIVAR
jgi:hypothetical protein